MFVPQQRIPSSPAATKETGTPWASEQIACVAPVEEESQGCLEMIEMHHGRTQNDEIHGIIVISPYMATLTMFDLVIFLGNMLINH